MISVERYPAGGFRVKIKGDRRVYLAQRVDYAVEGVKHYFGQNHLRKVCPICLKLHGPFKPDDKE